MSLKVVALLLRAVILPVGRELEGEHALVQLLEQRAFRVEALQRRLGVAAPVHARVLLARAADSLDLAHGTSLLAQPREHEVDGLYPHRDGLEDLPLLLVDAHALLYAIFRPEVRVEVDLGLRDDC